MATRKDVAARAGVSAATVSYVLNRTKNVTPQVRERVLQAVKELDYQPNLVARSLATSRTRHVAMLVDNLRNPYYCEMLEGAQEAASENGYIVSIISTSVSDKNTVLELTGRGVDGVILAMGAQRLEAYEDLLRLPQVHAGKSFSVSYRKAIIEMIRCFYEKGHRRIAFLSGIPISGLGHERYAAFLEGCRSVGLPAPEELIVNGTGRTDEEAGYGAMEELLARGLYFTAVFAVNDLMAVGAGRAIRERGYSIPGDISLAGCDNARLLDYFYPRLATIDVQAFETGRRLMESLIDEIRGEPGRYIGTEITGTFIWKESIGSVGKT